MTKQKWIVTGIAVPIILALVGLGFAAMSTNPPFTVPTWVPVLFFVLAGLMTVASVSYLLLWELLKRIRFQHPIILINQQGKTNVVSLNTVAKRSSSIRLEHDGVLWEDGGREPYASVDVHVIGPLCPKDYTPLSIKHLDDKIEAHINYDTIISDSVHYFNKLVCLECHVEYTLGNNPKRIRDSHDEVALRFLGMRKREQET